MQKEMNVMWGKSLLFKEMKEAWMLKYREQPRRVPSETSLVSRSRSDFI